MLKTLSSFAESQFVIMTICGATSDTKVGIMTTVDFQWTEYTPSLTSPSTSRPQRVFKSQWFLCESHMFEETLRLPTHVSFWLPPSWVCVCVCVCVWGGGGGGGGGGSDDVIFPSINYTIIVSDNGLSPGRHQAILWTNAGIFLIGPLGTNFNEILIKIQNFL